MDGLLLQREEGVFSWPSRSSGPSFFLSCLSSSFGDFYVSLWTLNNPHYQGTLGVHTLTL